MKDETVRYFCPASGEAMINPRILHSDHPLGRERKVNGSDWRGPWLAVELAEFVSRSGSELTDCQFDKQKIRKV